MRRPRERFFREWWSRGCHLDAPGERAVGGDLHRQQAGRDPEGKFYDENFVDGDLLAGDVREWAPSTPLWAGHYWWNVWSTDRDTFASYYSAPAEFTIPVAMTLRGVTTKRYLFVHALDVVVRLTANVQRPLVRVRLLRGQRIIWKASEKAYGSMSEVVSSSSTWYRPRRMREARG